MKNQEDKINVLFLGKFYPEGLLKTVKEDSKGKVGFSNHNFELSIIKGLIKQQDINLRVLTAPGVYSYPHNNNKFFTKAERYLYKGTPIRSVGFCNLMIINKIILTISLCLGIIKEFRKYDGKRINVILNTPSLFHMIALSIAQMLTSKQIDKTLIIPDIPSFVSGMDKMNVLKRCFVSIQDGISMRLAEGFDHFVLLTEKMKDLFKKKIDYIVMEGIIDVEENDTNDTTDKKASNKKIVLYTGTLRKIFGVMNLVHAFDVEGFDDAELHICGSGEAANEIAERASKNTNIKFHGLVDSEKARVLQHNATILVNPRTSEGEYTQYSFPSKTMEYLLTGNATIINRLPGIPEEYYNYVFTPCNESVASMRTVIRQVLDMSDEERQSYGAKGKEFILKRKNSEVQTARIIEMIKSKKL